MRTLDVHIVRVIILIKDKNCIFFVGGGGVRVGEVVVGRREE